MLKRKILVVILTLILMSFLVVGQVLSQEIPNITHVTQFQQTSLAANTVTFTDGNFMSGWTDITGVTDDPTVPGTGPGTSSFDGSSVQISGGNPGFYRETTHTVIYGDRVFSGGLNTSAIYIPSNSGVISEIAFLSDLLHPNSGSSGWALILEQDGILYYAVSLQAFSNSTWESFTSSALTEQDFDTALPGLEPNNVHPDFSASGSPITFGYVVTNSMPGPGTNTNSHGVDNWSIIVNPRQIFLPLLIR